jgi:uncharacterized protein YndB with AHSA1/START domain
MALTMCMIEEITATPDKVFRVMTDTDLCAKWMPNFVRIERLTPGPFGKGTRFREFRKMFGREASEVFEVTAIEPEKLLELYVDGKEGATKRGYYRFRYDLEKKGASTVVTLNGEIGGMGRFMSFLGKLMLGPMKKAIRKDLLAMKAYIETH